MVGRSWIILLVTSWTLWKEVCRYERVVSSLACYQYPRAKGCVFSLRTEPALPISMSHCEMIKEQRPFNSNAPCIPGRQVPPHSWCTEKEFVCAPSCQQVVSVGKWTATTGWRQQKEHKEFHYHMHSVQVVCIWLQFQKYQGRKCQKTILNHHWSLGDFVCEVGVGVDLELNTCLVSLPCWFAQSKPHPGQVTKKRKTELLRMQKPHCCSVINQFTLLLNVKLIFFLEPATSLSPLSLHRNCGSRKGTLLFRSA